MATVGLRFLMDKPMALPIRNSKKRMALSAAAGLTTLALAWLWGFSQYFGLEAKRASVEIWIERGCIAVRHSSPILMPWSPSDALAKAEQSVEPNLRMRFRPLQDAAVRFSSEWDLADEIGRGFVLPSFRAFSRQADFKFRVGWDRYQAVLPLWIPVLILSTALVISIRPRSSSSRPVPAQSLATEAVAIRTDSGVWRPRTLWLLGSGLGVIASSLFGLWIGAYLQGSGVEDISSRVRTLQCILDQPDSDSPTVGDLGELVKPEVSGSPDFVKGVHEALALLREKDTVGYQRVCRYISRISEGEQTHALVKAVPQRIMLDMYDVSYSLASCASILVHEACHCKLFKHAPQFGLSGNKACRGTAAELACIKEEVRTLKLLDAPLWLINYVEKADGTHWKNATRSRDWEY